MILRMMEFKLMMLLTRIIMKGKKKKGKRRKGKRRIKKMRKGKIRSYDRMIFFYNIMYMRILLIF
jgi:hypothetical protein